MKNEILLITFLLIVFFSIGENKNIDSNIIRGEPLNDNRECATTSFEKNNMNNSNLKSCDSYDIQDIEFEYLKRVQLKLKTDWANRDIPKAFEKEVTSIN